MIPVLPILISLSVCLSQAPTPNVGLYHFSLASGEGKGDAARISQGVQLEPLSLWITSLPHSTSGAPSPFVGIKVPLSFLL